MELTSDFLSEFHVHQDIIFKRLEGVFRGIVNSDSDFKYYWLTNFMVNTKDITMELESGDDGKTEFDVPFFLIEHDNCIEELTKSWYYAKYILPKEIAKAEREKAIKEAVAAVAKKKNDEDYQKWLELDKIYGQSKIQGKCQS